MKTNSFNQIVLLLGKNILGGRPQAGGGKAPSIGAKRKNPNS